MWSSASCLKQWIISDAWQETKKWAKTAGTLEWFNKHRLTPWIKYRGLKKQSKKLSYIQAEAILNKVNYSNNGKMSRKE